MSAVADLLLRAAQALDRRPVVLGACCIAIAHVPCGCTEDSDFDDCPKLPAGKIFKLFRPAEDDESGYWFGPPGTNKHERVLALLFAAAVAETEQFK